MTQTHLHIHFLFITKTLIEFYLFSIQFKKSGNLTEFSKYWKKKIQIIHISIQCEYLELVNQDIYFFLFAVKAIKVSKDMATTEVRSCKRAPVKCQTVEKLHRKRTMIFYDMY